MIYLNVVLVILRFFKYFFLNNIHFIFESKKIECEYTFYDIETTIANYPTEWYSGLLVCKF